MLWKRSEPDQDISFVAVGSLKDIKPPSGCWAERSTSNLLVLAIQPGHTARLFPYITLNVRCKV